MHIGRMHFKRVTIGPTEFSTDMITSEWVILGLISTLLGYLESSYKRLSLVPNYFLSFFAIPIALYKIHENISIPYSSSEN